MGQVRGTGSPHRLALCGVRGACLRRLPFSSWPATAPAPRCTLACAGRRVCTHTHTHARTRARPYTHTQVVQHPACVFRVGRVPRAGAGGAAAREWPQQHAPLAHCCVHWRIAAAADGPDAAWACCPPPRFNLPPVCMQSMFVSACMRMHLVHTVHAANVMHACTGADGAAVGF